MSKEELDLLRQIAQYSVAIDQHHSRSRVTSFAGRARVAPYKRPQPTDRDDNRRGGRAGHGLSRNRTLVFSKSQDDDDVGTTGITSQQWISSRDRGHMTLTNASVYDAATAAKLAGINETIEANRKEKLLRREKRDAQRLKYLASTTLDCDGILYRINKKASLLIRVDLSNVEQQPTPKRTTINGVEFLKSPKSHNLFRKSTVKLNAKKNRNFVKSNKYCKYFTRTGICTNAKKCPYKHDAEHVALCTHNLTSRGCTAVSCNLSHKPTPENTPTCTHFMTGTCTKEDCKYAHVSVSPSAPICTDFARNGYCAKGRLCHELHLRECPAFRSSGTCNVKTCRLPHIVRAGSSRVPKPASSAVQEEDSSSDSVCSSDDYESEDFDENAFGDFVKL